MAVCLLAIVTDAHAANRRWNGAAPDDNFGTTGNWVGGFVPGTLDVAQFGISGGIFQSTYNVNFNNNVTNQALHIEDDLVTFNLSGRTYTVTTASGIIIGNQVGGFSGQLTVNGGTISSSTNIDVGAAANTSGTLIVGANGLISGSPAINIGKLGTGTLTVQSDGDISSTGSTTIGVGNGITGTATIFGNGTAGSATLLTGTLNVGSTGNGTVNVQFGGLLQNSGAAVLGTGSLFTGVGTGIVNVMNAGSVWNSLGLLEVGNGGTGEVNITLGGTVTGTDNVIGANVNGGGEVNVDGSSSLWDSSGTVTIGGLGPGSLNITSQGVVESTDGVIGSADLPTSTGTVIVNGAGSRWINSDELTVGAGGTGTLNISSGGAVSSVRSRVAHGSSVSVDGSGSLWENSDRLDVGGTGAGTVNITGGGTVHCDSGCIVGSGGTGTVTVDGAGSLLDTPGGLVIGNGATATLEVTAGGRVQSRGGFVSNFTGHVTVDGDGSLWEMSDELTMGGLSGQGTLNITGGGRVLSIQRGTIGSEDGSSAVVTVDGDGSMWDSFGTLVVGRRGEGTLEITNGGLLQNVDGYLGSDLFSNASTGTGLVTVDGDGSRWLNTGTLTVGRNGTGTLHITNAGKVTTESDASIGLRGGSTGTVTVSSTVADADSAWEIGGRLWVGFNDPGSSNGMGTLRIQPGGKVTVTEATVVALDDLLSLEGGTLSTSGISFANGGNVGTNFAWTSGTLHVGVFQGDLVNSAGVLAPGNSVGTTEVQGNYNQLTNATLEIEIGPVGQGAQNDSVSVTGTATIDGQLSLSLINGASPQSSQTFIVLDAATLIGTFDNITSGQRLSTVDGLGSFLVHYGAGSAFDPTQIVLGNFLSAGLPGDYNENGVVDAADYVIWRKNVGTNNPLPNDSIGGTVGTAHYNQWRAHFGQTPGAGTGAAGAPPTQAAVPEPATLVLLMFAAACRWLRRGRAT